MALVKDALASATSADIYTNQLQIVMTDHTTASFVTGTAGNVLKAGTALAYNGTHYKKFEAADVSVAAFIWPNDVVQDDTDNATGEIMLKGEIRKFSEVNDLIEPADQAAFLASCKNELPAKGIIVRGIANINQ